MNKKIANTVPIPKSIRLYIAAAAAVSVVVVGYVLLSTMAAGPSASIEAETAVVQPAKAIDDPTASEGKIVQFGPAATPGGDTGGGLDRPVRIMPLGDSITLGIGDSSGQGAYRINLWKQLANQDKLSIDFVGSVSTGPNDLGDKNHEGHSGWCITAPCRGSTNNAITRTIDGWLDNAKPDIITLHIGTNDINGGVSSGAEMKTRLDGLLSKIYTRSPQVYMVVAQIIPMNNSSQDRTVAAYNSGIAELATKYQAQGRKMQVVDMSNGLSKNSGDFHDNLHPNRKGYDKMAELWYPAVKAAYEAVR